MSTTNYGLRPIVRDKKDFAVGAVVRLLPKSQLPKKFVINIPDEWVREQKFDTCAGEALGVLLSHINGYKVDATLTWVVSRMNNDYGIDDWGIDIRSILLGAVKMGAPRYEESQYHSTDERSIFADITKWDLKDQLPKSIVNKAGTAVFIEPTNGMDYFDSIRSTIVTLGNPALWGMMWNFDPSQPKILKPSDTGYGHCKLILGYDDEQMDILDLNISLNSWGLSVGIKGRYFVSRETVNHDVAIFGAGTLIDETPEKVKWHLDNGIYLNDGNWLLNIAKAFVIAIKQSLTIVFKVPQKSETGVVPPYPAKIVKMAEAMARKEGWYEKVYIKNRPQRNFSMFNARYVGQYKAIGEDRRGVPEGKNGYAIFPDEKTGWEYCYKVLYNVCAGKSVAYNSKAKLLGLANSGEMNWYQYLAIFAPSDDNNDPKKYADDVCQWVGISPYDKLNFLLS